ncbi:MAG TPA: ferredoxin [Armatimonadota bacterium]|jgi:ferredoxin
MAKRNNPERCIQCNACLPDTPLEGITIMNAVFVLDPRLCPECAGLYPPSRCQDIRPVDVLMDTMSGTLADDR